MGKMTKDDFVMKYGVLFTDEEVFGDTREHECHCDCYDGVALGWMEDMDTILPDIVIKYPKREDVMKDAEMCDYILRYCGLYDLDKEEINYGDIMLALGTINKTKKELCGNIM